MFAIHISKQEFPLPVLDGLADYLETCRNWLQLDDKQTLRHLPINGSVLSGFLARLYPVDDRIGQISRWCDHETRYAWCLPLLYKSSLESELSVWNLYSLDKVILVKPWTLIPNNTRTLPTTLSGLANIWSTILRIICGEPTRKKSKLFQSQANCFNSFLFQWFFGNFWFWLWSREHD